MRRDTHRVGVGDRGQSVFDFSIGVSLFLVVVLAVLVFVPTAFGSLSDDSGVDNEDRLAAERVADHLVETALAGSDGQPGLDRACVLAYFDNGVGCGFETGSSVGVESARAPTQPLNVTIEADVVGDSDREVLCWDRSAEVVDHVANCGDADDTAFAAGSSAVRNENYVASTRLTEFETSDVFVVVRTW